MHDGFKDHSGAGFGDVLSTGFVEEHGKVAGFALEVEPVDQFHDGGEEGNLRHGKGAGFPLEVEPVDQFHDGGEEGNIREDETGACFGHAQSISLHSLGEFSAESLHLCHSTMHPIRTESSPLVSGGRACGVSSLGSVGAPGWGRGSMRSAWCCPGCGLFGDGTMCKTCMLETHGGGNSCTYEITKNLRVVRSHELGEGSKTPKVSSRIQVGRPIVEYEPGSASLADYLRWAPRSWPVEAWECRVVNSPNAKMKKRFSQVGVR